MKKYPVISGFIDKNTNRYFPIGAIYETTDKGRADELRDGGFLGEELKEPKTRTSQKDGDKDANSGSQTSSDAAE